MTMGPRQPQVEKLHVVVETLCGQFPFERLQDLPGAVAGAGGDAFGFFLGTDEDVMLEGFHRSLLGLIVGRR